ncbi:Fungal Zn(2)-Cys(6) binuclear cluster domain [Ceratobasidium sp. AG-Ba]|nr:Fungal Zn(2)-Cys(6) binuclear cluster domain [Ceratobasidium sp. AG-Ba]
MRAAPGPRPTSCITCQRRKKKCDKTRPSCNRCTELGQQCLGYGRKGTTGSGTSTPRTLGSSSSGLDGEDGRMFESTVEVVETDSDQSASASMLSLGSYSASSSSSFLEFDPTESYQAGPQSSGSSPHYLSSVYHPSAKQWTAQLSVESPTSSHASAAAADDDDDDDEHLYRNTSTAMIQQDHIYDPLLFVAVHAYSLPPRLNLDPRISGETMMFITSQYERLFEVLFFRPAGPRMQDFRTLMISRVQSSNLGHLSNYVGAQMLSYLGQDDGPAKIQRFSPILERLDRLCLTSNTDTSLDSLVDRLTGALEAS